MKKQKETKEVKEGFTIVEVMLVLGIAGLMLVGLIGGTFTSIARQRYNDSVRDFAAYMRSVYNEVISPQSFGYNSGGDFIAGNSRDRAILGKIVVFGYNNQNTVYSATLVGSTSLDRGTSRSFLEEILDTTENGANISIFCGDGTLDSTVQSYTPLWEARLTQANGIPDVAGSYTAHYPDRFKGTMIIARTPTSSTVHTIFSPGQEYDLAGNCSGASGALRSALESQRLNSIHYPDTFSGTEAVGICVVSDNSAIYREIRIAADGRNSSAIWIRDADDGDNRCQN